jgi:hypothetical protein
MEAYIKQSIGITNHATTLPTENKIVVLSSSFYGNIQTMHCPAGIHPL